MLAEKKTLSVADLDSQSAFELPDRQMMQVTVIITNLLNHLSVDVDVTDVNVGVQVCAAVNALNTILLSGNNLTCNMRQ